MDVLSALISRSTSSFNVDFLLDMTGDELIGQVTIISPYRSQEDSISTAVRIRCRNLRPKRIQWSRNVLICTVGCMQGRQRNVIIFSTTRSNQHGNVGFVKEGRRHNVSVKRARYVNIILGDHTTILTKYPNPQPSTSGRQLRHGIKALENVYYACSEHREPGARLGKVVNNPTFQTYGTVPKLISQYQPIRNIPGTVQTCKKHQLYASWMQYHHSAFPLSSHKISRSNQT